MDILKVFVRRCVAPTWRDLGAESVPAATSATDADAVRLAQDDPLADRDLLNVEREPGGSLCAILFG
jgi:hypothetical protein